MKSIKNVPFFSSWSGGKDSCLALYRAIKAGGIPQKLFTMFACEAERSRSHGLSVDIIKAQSEALSIPFITARAEWGNYENVFLTILKQFYTDGIYAGVFGDIDLQPHLDWVQRVCSMENITPYEPLWKEERRALITEFVDSGFKAVICACKEGVLDKSFLGRTLSHEMISEMETLGIDACGEEGEYHSVVVDGPIFNTPVSIVQKDIIERSGYYFLDICLG